MAGDWNMFGDVFIIRYRHNTVFHVLLLTDHHAMKAYWGVEV